MDFLNSRLNEAQRNSALLQLREDKFDLVIVGGGITGSGIALDAASRGLKVALIEKADLASGTSSRSSKLIHGGLRYLEQFHFSLVREALSERKLMLTDTAPHLVRPLPFLFPLEKNQYRFKSLEKLVAVIGLTLYDLLSGTKSKLPKHHYLTKKQVSEHSPSIQTALIHGGIRFFDAQVDDARHTLTVARTAASYGAVIATGVECVQLMKDDDCVIGTIVKDLSSGEEFQVSAEVVIMASGIWNSQLSKKFGIDISYELHPSKGVHLVLDKSSIRSDSGIILKTEKSVLFIIPWESNWIVGTTDTPYQGDLDNPVTEMSEIDFILEQANRVLNPKISKKDILTTFSGIRPLVSNSTNPETTKISREHKVDHPNIGLVSISGGKYTTYRIMACDAVNEAQKDLPEHLKNLSCETDKIPLLGASNLAFFEDKVLELSRDSGLSNTTITHLLKRYGSLITEILDIVERRPQLGSRITEQAEYIKAEAIYAITHEGARSIQDILLRRTRLAMELPDFGSAISPMIANMIAPRLNWSPEQTQREVALYQSEAGKQVEQLRKDAF